MQLLTPAGPGCMLAGHGTVVHDMMQSDCAQLLLAALMEMLHFPLSRAACGSRDACCVLLHAGRLQLGCSACGELHVLPALMPNSPAAACEHATRQAARAASLCWLGCALADGLMSLHQLLTSSMQALAPMQPLCAATAFCSEVTLTAVAAT